MQASGAAVSWGTALNSAAGGQYRLCWCGALGDCTDPQDFAVDVGELYFYGPAPVSQDRTCVSGRTCSFVGHVYGDHTWSVSIMDTCGLNHDPPQGAAVVAATGSVTSVTFDTLTSAGGGYRLCWCSARTCSTSESFAVDAGKLELVGVSRAQDRTCISGRTCEIDGLRGYHISNHGYLQILETCGETGSHPYLPRQQLSVQGGSARAIWPVVPVAAYGGQYKICWCSSEGANSYEGNSSHDCASSQDFSVEVGNLLVLGPSFPEQMRTCISGHSCRLTGLLGESFAGGSEILVAETCGTASVIPGFPQASQTLEQNLLVEVAWTMVTAAGGRYRLCWCWPLESYNASAGSGAGGAGDCEVASKFRIDLGTLTLLGPLRDQDRTCTSGLSCFIDGILGEGLRTDTDNVLVLETCGVNQVVPRFSGAGVFTDISRSGASVSWGAAPNTAAGGGYRLCWCSQSACSTPSDFQVDFGSLLLLGVAPLDQTLTCVAGRACPSSWSFGVSGVSWSSFGTAIALETCGAERALAPPRMQSNITGVEILERSAAGKWRLCWCASGPTNDSVSNRTMCETMLDYIVDIGELSILGPLPTNGHTCVSGLPCFADGLLGLDLSRNDSFVILSTCGTETTPMRFPNAALATFDPGTGTLRWDGNGSFTALTAAGGQHRLCWCHPVSSVDCLASADFRYDVGSFAILGPAPLQQHRTCISGAACALEGLTGNLLSDADAVMVMQSCGSKHGAGIGVPASELGNASLILTPSGGSYRICWCTPPARAFVAGLPSFAWQNRDGCNLAEDFLVDIGAFTILGPLRDHARTCVAGAICSSAIQGLGLSLDYRLQILDTCSGSGQVAEVETRNNTRPLWFDKISSAGGAYRLCWCALQACNEMVDIGTVFLLGVTPLQQDRTCVAGQACRLDGVSSYGELDASHLMILQTCNVPHGLGIADVHAAADSAVAHGNFSNASGEMSAVQSKAWFLDEVTLPGGGYRLCWCGSMAATGAANDTGGPDNLTASDCRVIPGSQVDFGELLVIGPSNSVEVTCVSGQACVVDGLLGQHLSTGDFIIILDTCRVPSRDLDGFPQNGLATSIAAGGSAANWGLQTPLTGQGGSYRLCWCAAGFSCSSSEDFAVEVGSLSLRGPIPLGQDRTCVAGYSCNIGFDGMDMSPYVVEAVSSVRLALLPSNVLSAGLSVLDVHYGTSAHLHAPNVSVTLAASCSMSNTGSFLSAGQALLWYSCSWQPAVTASQWFVSLQSDATLQIYEVQFLGRNGWTTISDGVGVDGDAGRLSDGLLSSWVLAGSGHPVELIFTALQPDTIVIADTCATSSSAWGPVPLSPYAADVLTVQGGLYRMCWCARGFRCSFKEDFSVNAGLLTIVGPKTVHNTCIAGHSCYVELDGQYLSDRNQVLVLHTCAVEDAHAWKLTDLGTWRHLSSSGATLSSKAAVTSSAGSYKLCWCSGFSACETASDFSVEAGELWVLGVAPLFQAHTCISGQSCVVDHLTGLGLSKDQVMILDTCGTQALLYRGLDATELVNGSSTILTWTNELTVPGGQYRLCWCSTQYAQDACATASDYQVDFGQFTILGPSPLQQTWTCIAGQSCRIDGSTGFGTGLPTEIVIMDTCGAPDSQIVFHSAPMGGLSSSWEKSLLSIPGASYRLCWCAIASYPCTMAESYRVDFGQLLVLGPAPLMQDRTCVSGSRCEVDGFLGMGLSSSDLVVMQDTCADHRSRIGLPAGGSLISLMPAAGSAYMSAESVRSSNGTIIFNTLTATGGQYRLCWTSWMALQVDMFGNSSENSSIEEAVNFLGGCNDTLGGNRTCALPHMPGRLILPTGMIDIGRLTLMGPAPLDQVHTCVSGQRCSFGGITGMHLDVRDQIAVMDTCGMPGRVDESSSVRHFASWVDFGATTLPGATYRLCWCSAAAGCSLAEHFLVDFGRLSILGPTQSEQFTCVSGRLCTVKGLLGRSFSSLDRLAIFDTCGLPPGSSSLPPIQGGPTPLVPRIPSDGTGISTSSGAAVQWDGKFTAFGGLYRLCWCAGSPTGAFDNPAQDAFDSLWSGVAGVVPSVANGSNLSSRRLAGSSVEFTNSGNVSNLTDPGFLCQQASQFRVDVGELLLIGPSRLPAATCVSGQTCVIDVVTQPSENFILMDTCGESVSSLGGPAVGTSVVSWGPQALVGAGGTYRLCWCWNDAAVNTNSSNATGGSSQVSAPGIRVDMNASNTSNVSRGSHEPCQQMQDYAVEVGPVLLLGPSPLQQDRTCVSGHTCAVEGIVGTELEDLLVQDTCGSPSSLVLPVNYSAVDHRWELPVLTQQGGTYRLCWCSGMFSCRLEDFRVDFGTLHLLGPMPLSQHRTCISGCPCTVDRLEVYTQELAGMSLQVQQACASMQLLDGFPTDAAGIDTSTRSATWSEITASGGIYSLCWHVKPDARFTNFTGNGSLQQSGNENHSLRNSLPVDHSVFMGQLLLIGPARDHGVTCISGGRCAVRVRGLHLSDSDFMAILDTCGVSTSSQQLAAVQQLEFTGAQSVLVDWPSTSMKMDGGQYRMCWCSGLVQTAAWANASETSQLSPCDSAQSFRVDAGSLSVRGPRPVLRTCLVGRPCLLTELDGFALSPSDQLLLLETCGSPRVADGGLSQSLHEEMSVRFTISRAGSYRLCWCGAKPWSPNTTACSSPFEFTVDAGEVLVLGPLPSQLRTCVSGLRCALEGLLGTGLDEDDRVLVMDTCGSPNVVPLFPAAGLSQEVGSRGAYVSWGNAVITSKGGAYRLCWCSRNLNTSHSENASDPECSLPSAFGVDFGTLVLRGPAELANPLYCILGDDCIMQPVSGMYTSALDWVRVLDTCGIDARQPAYQADISLQVLSLAYARSNVSADVNVTGGPNQVLGVENHSSVMIPAAGIPAAGGQYRLCWCGHESNCLAASSYRVDFGSISLTGPLQGQSRTCVSGNSCVVSSILGYGLSNETSFLVMDTCGQSGAVQGAFSGLAVLSSGAAVQWSAEPVTGGLYRLCWCGAAMNSRNSTQGRCDSSWSFKVDFGGLIVRGPSPLSQTFTCIAGQPCRFDGVRGQDLSFADQYLVLDTCSRDRLATDVLDVRIAFSEQPFNSSLQSEGMVSVPGGQYRLCWCGRASTQNLSHHVSCSLPTDYLVDFASISVIGPSSFDQDKTCIAGMSCAIRNIEGYFTSSGDALMVAATCGQSEALIHGLSRSGLMLPDAQVNSTFRWLLTSTSAQGGQYRLCWCADGQVCSTMEHFTVDVGAFSLLGPTPMQQAFTCVAGRECSIDPITGFHLNENRLVVLETCGSERGVLRIPNSGLSVSSGAASWGPLPLTAAGGQYRLCWCADLVMKPLNESQNTSRGCRIFSDYTYDIGSFSILGPAPVLQSRTCVSGQNCQLDGFTGHGLSNLDKLLVLDTCGEPTAVVPKWSLAGGSVETTSSGTAASWQAIVSAAGGQYRLCWCATLQINETSAGQFCTHAGDFAVDMGAMWLLGPTPLLQDRTCISGQTCSSKGMVATTGGGVFLSGRVHVLDTCGQVGFLERFPAGGLSGEVRPLEGIVTSPLAGDLLDVRGMSVVSWTSEALTVSAGQYRLCWCALLPGPTNISGCVLTSEFSVDFGALHLYGPLPGHHRTCVSGYTCSFGSIAGYGLSQNDTILVMETCGSNHVAARFPWSGFIDHISASGSRMSWGETPISAHGGSYRLCWCSQSASCRRPEAFPFDFGELLLVGPAQVDQTCVAGQICYLDGLPRAWSELNSYMILETCGIADIITASPVLSAQGQADWGASPLTSADLQAGIYQLCWCAPLPPSPSVNATHSNHSEGNLTGPCRLSLQHQVTVGTLMMIGASAEQQRTCVSGLTCVIDSIEGYHLSMHDKVLIMETCGTQVPTGFSWTAQASNASAGRLSFSWGAVHITPPGGSYRLCWCGASMACSQVWEFRADFGQLQVLGPAPLMQHQTCVSGHLCRLSSGIEHANSSDSVGLRYAVLAMDTCGGVSVPQGFPLHWTSNSSSNATADSLLSASMQEIATAPGSTYRLCWCGIPETATGCRLPADFRVHVGELTMIGPRLSSHTCISGRLCSLEDLQGLHLSSSNMYMVLDTCGVAASAWPEGYAGLVKPGIVIPEETATLAGQYQLCWCASLHVANANATENFNASLPCRRAEDFASSSGTFTILGPAPLHQQRTCISGQTCVLDGLTGLGLSNLDLLAVQDTCGLASAPSRFPAAAKLQVLPGPTARVAWEHTRPSSAGGKYRLCWTRLDANSSNSSMPAVSFKVDIGELLLLGPSPLEQSATCVSGQSCVLDVLSGYGLDSGGHLMLADTCGVQAEDRLRLPSDGLTSWGANETTVSWSQAFTAAGQSYKLCWCAVGLSCSAEHFVDVGVLSLIGPAPLSQGRTCISGSRAGCSFALDLEPFQALSLSNSSGQSRHILISASCGVATATADLPPAQFLGPLGSASWTSLVLPGGEYRLCWCAQDACEISESFRVDLGRFLVLGPSQHHQATCLSGQTCQMYIPVTGGSDFDSLLLAETCGATRSKRRQPFPMIPEVHRSAPDVLSVSWGTAALVQSGGEYQLCWCGHSCGDTSSFISTAGSLYLRGPAPLQQQFTCLAGQSCSLETLSGYGMSNAGVLLLMDTCAIAASTTLQFIPGEPEGLISDYVPLAGGSYRLCWCALLGSTNSSGCDLPSSFLTDAGTVHIIGPVPLQQQYTCVSGQTCTLRGLQGSSLQQSDFFAVLDTCGSLDAWPLNLVKVLNLQPDGLTVSWREDALSTPGGQYRLCWCATAARCQDASSLRVDFGSLTLIGPEQLFMDRTCISGRTCSFDGLISGSGLLVLDTCGLPSVGKRWDGTPTRMPHFMSQLEHMEIEGERVTWGNLQFSAAGGAFRLCWCAGNSTCLVPEDFQLDIGQLLLIGPSFGHTQSCISGQVCSISRVKGWQLSDSDRIMVLDTCAQPGNATQIPSAIVGFAADGMSWSAVQELNLTDEMRGSTYGPLMRFELAGYVSAQGGRYRLCWCGASAVCSSSEDFYVDFGELQVLGPSHKSATCVSGQPCFLNSLAGHYVPEGQVAIFDTCGVHGVGLDGAGLSEAVGGPRVPDAKPRGIFPSAD